MASLIESITSPLSKAGDLIQGLVEIRDTVKFGEAVNQLQAQIMAALQGATTAQSQQLAMGDEIRELKEQIVKLEKWEAEKERYKLHQLPPGVYVYSLKPDCANGEPPHQICEKCYQEGKKGVLHSDEQRNGIYHLTCNACGTKLEIGHYRPPHMGTAETGWIV